MAQAPAEVYDSGMTGTHFAPYLRSRPHALAPFTAWRALPHGLESAPDGKAKRTIAWRNIAEIRLAVERQRRDLRRRCDIATRDGERITIFGPAPGRLIDLKPEGDYADLMRAVIGRSRGANPSCRFVHGRFFWRMTIFHTLVFAACMMFVEVMGRVSGMTVENAGDFAWLRLGALAVISIWSLAVVAPSLPRQLDPEEIPDHLLAA